MPRVPRLAGVVGRVFARIDRFECECPHCGRLILPKRSRQKRGRVFNPHTQLLWCPGCESVFVVGLLLFQTPPRGQWRRPLNAPIDAQPTREQRIEMARLAGAYLLDETYQEDQTPVNRYVEGPCSCPPKGWAATCPVHGE